MLKNRSQKKQSVKESLLSGIEYDGGDKKVDDEFNDAQDATKQRSMTRSRSKASDETKIKILEQFGQYSELFEDLTLRNWVDTEYDVI